METDLCTNHHLQQRPALSAGLLQRIERAFEQMPEEYREVITLAHLVGLSRAEIAQQLGKSEGAVRVLLHRALARMSSILSGPGTGGEGE